MAAVWFAATKPWQKVVAYVWFAATNECKTPQWHSRLHGNSSKTDMFEQYYKHEKTSFINKYILGCQGDSDYNIS